jgi:hypothetical protein
VFEIVCCSQQAFYFLFAIDRGQFPIPGTWGYLKLGLVPFAKIPVEADKTGQIGVYGSPGQFAILKKVEKIVLNLFVAQRVGGLFVIFGQSLDTGYITSFCVIRESLKCHVI